MHTRALARCARLSILFATSVVALASCAGGEEEAGPPLDSIPGVSRDANTNPPMLELDLDAQTFAGAGGGPVGGSGNGTGGGGGAGGTSSGGDAGPDGAVPVGGRLDASPPPPVATQCSNGQDDDGDGFVDAYDGDCSSAADPTEQGDRPPTGCGNGLDDDGDGAVDFPDDPGCLAVGDGDEADPEQTAECADGVDNDGNGRTDYPEDPGCPGRGTALEAPLPAPPACTNGVDDDEDGATDYPDDPDCAAAAAPTEGIAGECGDTHRVVDLNRALGDADFVDGDTSMGAVGFVGTCGGNAGPEIVFRYRVSGVVGALEFTTEYPETTAPTVVYVRPVCTDPRDVGCNRGSADAPGTHVRLDRPAEGTYYVVVDTSQADRSGAFRLGVLTVEAPRCSDTRDNDQDGRVDLFDPGCVDPTDEDEADPPAPPECGDGLDNDGDGQTDYPADPTCTAAGGPRETEASCALAPDVIVAAADVGVVHVNTSILGSNYTGRCGGRGPEQVIALVLDAPATVTALTVNNGMDTVLHARSACDDEATELACNDDAGGDLASNITFVAPAAGVYYLFADSFGGGGETDVMITVQ
jgi:hypothetical protein